MGSIQDERSEPFHKPFKFGIKTSQPRNTLNFHPHLINTNEMKVFIVTDRLNEFRMYVKEILLSLRSHFTTKHNTDIANTIFSAFLKLTVFILVLQVIPHFLQKVFSIYIVPFSAHKKIKHFAYFAPFFMLRVFNRVV